MDKHLSIVSSGLVASAGVAAWLPLASQANGDPPPADEWQELLKSLEVDDRVWPIAAGILESRVVEFHVVTGDQVRIASDLFGFTQRVFERTGKRRPWRESLYRVNGGLLLTRAGWDYALPNVQRVLDHLNIAYDQSASGLVCRLGRHAAETVYVDDGACEYPMFDRDHGNRHSYGYCHAIWNGRELASVCRLPSRRQLVFVEGWPRCKGCQSPIRPPELRSHVASVRAA